MSPGSGSEGGLRPDAGGGIARTEAPPEQRAGRDRGSRGGRCSEGRLKADAAATPRPARSRASGWGKRSSVATPVSPKSHPVAESRNDGRRHGGRCGGCLLGGLGIRQPGAADRQTVKQIGQPEPAVPPAATPSQPPPRPDPVSKDDPVAPPSGTLSPGPSAASAPPLRKPDRSVPGTPAAPIPSIGGEDPRGPQAAAGQKRHPKHADGEKAGHAGDKEPGHPHPTKREGRPDNDPVKSIEARTSVHLTLPSGAALTDEMLAAPDGWRKELFPKSAVIFNAGSDKTLQLETTLAQATVVYVAPQYEAVLTTKKGRLDGPAVMSYNGGQTLGRYKQGQRDGPVRQWNKKGERVLYANCKFGRNNGLTCLFQENMPWLVQEWRTGKAQGEYLVQWERSVGRIISDNQMNDDERKENARAASELANLQKQLNENERTWKSTVKEWYREEDKRQKAALRPALAARQRDAFRRESAARADEAARNVDAAWRQFHGR